VLIKKIYHLNTLHFYQRKLENEQRKSYRILISSCWTTDIRLFVFYRIRGLGPEQSHYNQSRLWSRLQTTLAQHTPITPSEYTLNTLYWKYFHRSGFLSSLRLPWKTEFALKCFTVLNIFFTIHEFWATLRLPWKTEFALKFFTALDILFTFRIFEQLALALKNRVCPDFTVLNIYFFIIQDFWVTCACPEIFHCIEIFFIIQDF